MRWLNWGTAHSTSGATSHLKNSEIEKWQSNMCICLQSHQVRNTKFAALSRTGTDHFNKLSISAHLQIFMTKMQCYKTFQKKNIILSIHELNRIWLIYVGLIGHVLKRNLQMKLNTVHAYKLCDSQKSQVLHKLDSTYVDSCSPSPCAHIFQHKNLHGNKVHNDVAIFPLFSLLCISNEK